MVFAVVGPGNVPFIGVEPLVGGLVPFIDVPSVILLGVVVFGDDVEFVVLDDVAPVVVVFADPSNILIPSYSLLYY